MSLNNKDISGDYPICEGRGLMSVQGAIRQSAFDDIDEQAAQLVGHDQCYQQLSAGRFRGRFTTAELGGDAWLFIEETNQALAQHCHVPPGMVSFMFLLGTAQWVRLEQDEFGPDALAVFPALTDFFVRCPADTTFCVITLEQDRLARTLDFFPDQPGPGAYCLQSRQIGPAVAALRSLVGAFLSMIATSQSEVADALAQFHLKEALLSTLALAVTSGTRTARSLPPALFDEARAMIDANLGIVSVTELCTTFDVSRRTLEQVFHRQVGIGPARFIKILRLNQIRRALRSPDCERAIADVAAEWGIWHPSHFATDYAAMFGELPSLARRGQDGRTHGVTIPRIRSRGVEI